MKRDNELQKPVAHTSIWLRKRESDLYIEMYGAQKALKCMVLKKPKANYQCWNIKNFKHQSQKEMYYPKRINVIIYEEAKWKASKFCNHSLVGGHICSFL